ncbi:MAG: hypothetical protein ACOYOT_10000 [Bacteroidales bacterium]
MKKLSINLFMLLLSFFFVTSLHAQDDFTQGSNYYLISLDQATADKIGATNIAADLRPDDMARFLYVWSSTYVAGTASGPNWNGEVGEFISLSVGSVGWSGFGFAAVGTPVNMSGITSDYTFHIAMKSTATNSHIVALRGGNGLEARVCIGATAFVDGALTYQPYTNFTRDGKWHLVEIPISVFMNLGLRYPEPFTDNYFYMLSGNNPGKTIDLDAVFIYKKNSAGVNSLKVNSLAVMVTSKTVSVSGATEPLEVFSLTGQRVFVSKEPIFDVKNLTKGAYVIRSGSFMSKFVVK